jgi:hypothetical protein
MALKIEIGQLFNEKVSLLYLWPAEIKLTELANFYSQCLLHFSKIFNVLVIYILIIDFIPTHFCNDLFESNFELARLLHS